MKTIKSTYVIIGLVALLVLSNTVSYFSLKDMEELLDRQRNEQDALITTLEESYGELQNSYIELVDKNERLESRLQEKRCKYTEDEVYLLAQCVEAEAGYYEGHELSQQYVTQVILNRLHSGQFPNAVEEVIYQKTNGCPQFSVAYNGMMDDREVEPETLANVYSVLVHGTDLPEYVLYFYSASVTENWVNTLNTYTTESGTVFAYESKEVY